MRSLRERTVEQTAGLRDLELRRFDAITAGLWPEIQAGNPPAVTAAIRVSERRARLLGLDEPVLTKSELTGSLGVYAEQLAADRELFGKLSIEQLEELAAESQALVDKAMAMARVQLVPQIEATLPGAPVGGESLGAPAETPTGIEVGEAD